MQVMLDPFREGGNKDSIFPWATRPYTDETYDGLKVTIPHSSNEADILRILYGNVPIESISARFPFLDRHYERKEYQPGKEDPFVAKTGGEAFVRSEMMTVFTQITNLGKELHIPITKDADRKVDVIDFKKVTDTWLESTKDWDGDMLNALSFIFSNVDIARKLATVRSAIVGWWMASYAGKETQKLDEFTEAADLIADIEQSLRKTEAFKAAHQGVLQSQGDPLISNTGYPYFEGLTDTDGNPITKIKAANLFEGIGAYMTKDHTELLSRVDALCPNPVLKGHPFCIAPLSRLSAGYKWAHTFEASPSGLRSSRDIRGNCSIRIAWMASYPLNLMLSPVQAVWKAQRMLKPGCYHTAYHKKSRFAAAKGKTVFTTEADYTNYDRYIPINLFELYNKKFFGNVDMAPGRKSVYQGLLSYLHRGISIMLPDRIPPLRGKGWLCKPRKLGLLSGLKITGEEGTTVNEHVHVQSLLSAGTMGKKEIKDMYLHNAAMVYKGQPQGFIEPFLIQSDDSLIQSESQSTLKKMTKTFMEFANFAGLKGEAMIGDRMLMRQVQGHRDAPVPLRVYQNTLSNEASVTSFAKFYIGMTTRCDGLLGIRIQDAFGLGGIYNVTYVETSIVHIVMDSLIRVLSNATIKHNPAIEIATIYRDEARRLLDIWRDEHKDLEGFARLKAAGRPSLKASPEVRARLTIHLKKSAQLMVEEEARTKADDSLIASLHRNEHVPSVQLYLDQLIALRPELAATLTAMIGREHTFYIWAMKKLGINPNLFQLK